jgi:thiamine pyrophosphokinase
VRASVIDDRNQAWALIGPDTARVASGGAKYLSVVPLSSQVRGVTLRGVKFPLTEATLTLGGTLSVSNEFAAAEASVTIGDGVVLVIRSDD